MLTNVANVTSQLQIGHATGLGPDSVLSYRQLRGCYVVPKRYSCAIAASIYLQYIQVSCAIRYNNCFN